MRGENWGWLPKQSYLRERLEYDPLSGFLYWKKKPECTAHDQAWNTRYAGKRAFTHRDANGYMQGRLDGKLYGAQRVIWKWMTGETPFMVDHEDGNRSRNIWKNLRAAQSDVDSNTNLGVRKDSSSGVTGVVWIPSRRRWVAQIHSQGATYRLGSFVTIEEAKAARLKGEEAFGFHQNHGKRDSHR